MNAKIARALIPAGQRVKSSNFNDHIKIPNIGRILHKQMINPGDK